MSYKVTEVVSQLLCITHLKCVACFPQYLKKLHTQERAVEEVKLAIKPYYQRKDINKDEYKDILRKAVHKVSSGEHKLHWSFQFMCGLMHIECFQNDVKLFRTTKNLRFYLILWQICHSRTGEINPVKVSNLVKLYVQRYKYFRKHGRKMDEEEREDRESGVLHSSA